MVYLPVFFVGKPFWFLGVRLEARFEGVEDWIGVEGVVVCLDGVGLAIWRGLQQILGEYLLIEI